jgi:hypothetical protein
VCDSQIHLPVDRHRVYLPYFQVKLGSDGIHVEVVSGGGVVVDWMFRMRSARGGLLTTCARYPSSALLWVHPIFVMNNELELKGTLLPQKTKIYLSKHHQKGLRMRLNGLRSAPDVARGRLTSGEADT